MCLHHDCGGCPADPRTSRRAQEEAVKEGVLSQPTPDNADPRILPTYSVQKQLADVLVANFFNTNTWAAEDGQDRAFEVGAEGSVNDTTEVRDLMSFRLFTSPSEHSIWAAMKGTSAELLIGDFLQL